MASARAVLLELTVSSLYFLNDERQDTDLASTIGDSGRMGVLEHDSHAGRQL